jgi:hypothetical protein
MYWAAPMTSTLSGEWSTPTATGACNGEATIDRILRFEFIRRSLNWHYPTVGLRWELPGPTNPRCQIQASDGDEQVTRTFKEPYRFHYPGGPDLTYTKAVLLNKKTITIPVHLHGTEKRSDMQATFELNGTVVLTRYRACSVSTLAQILHGRHCWDPSYP